MSRRALGAHTLTVTLYTVVSLVMTWPLGANLTSAVPGIEGDLWSYVWMLGWGKTALAVGTNPFHSDYVFYPLGGATQFLWAGSLIGLLAVPLQYFFSLIVTFNLFYLAATIATAFGTFLLAREIRLGVQAAFLAGLCFAFGALRQGYGLAFFNLYNTALIPFYVLFLIRALDRGHWKDVFVAGGLFGLNAYLDFQLAAFLGLFTAIFALAFHPQVNTMTRSERGRGQYLRERITRLAALGVVAAIVMLPMAAILKDEFGIEGGDYIRVFPLRYSAARSYDVLSYLIPNARSTVYQSLPSPRVVGVNATVSVEGESQLSPDRQAFLGYTTIFLSICALGWNKRRARVWALIGLVFAIFSLGPSLHLFGMDTGVPLPFIALHQIPVLDHIRVPMRYGLLVSFCIAIIAGIGLEELQKRIGRQNTTKLPNGSRPGLLVSSVAATLSGLVLIESAVLPYPSQTFAPNTFYSRLANEPGDFSILEIPSYNWRDAAKTEAYQVIHKKRILRAYTNRIAPDLADYFSLRQTPIIVRSLRILEGGEKGFLSDEEIREDRANRDVVLGFYGVKYAVLHHDMLTPEENLAIESYLADVLSARQVESDGRATLYALELAGRSKSPLVIDTATNIGLMYLGRGWQSEPMAEIENVRGRFMRGLNAEIYFLADGSAKSISLRAVCEDSNTKAGVLLDDLYLTTITIGTEWNQLVIDLSGSVKSGMNRLLLRMDLPQAENCAVSEITLQ
ncbi:MAG TPA: hypothetical protein VIX58_12925 [Anaerolineae bacterium]